MRASSVLLILASLAAAQNTTISLCDKYTTALLKVNNATTQYTLLTLLVNTALIGNYTQPNTGIAVNGILNPGTYNGTSINLLPYFNGDLLSSNGGSDSGISLNFLDDGGAAPLKMNMPSNGNQASNQYMLITHLYEFFGYLLGCSAMGQAAFPSYSGSTSMYNVHKFMDIDALELGYFITQVGTAAASFGVSAADITTVAYALQNAFGYRCAPPIAIPATASPALQAICVASDCPLNTNATCAAYANAIPPTYTNGSTYVVPGATSGAASSATGTTSGTATHAASASASGSGSGSSGAQNLSFEWTITTLVVGLVALGMAANL